MIRYRFTRPTPPRHLRRTLAGIAVCLLLTFTGCASLFGPYVPEEDLNKWRATASRQEPADEQLSEFDTADTTVTAQVVETEQAAETQNPVWDSLKSPVVETPTLPFEPPIPELPATQPDTTPPSENPFAEMARQGIL